MADTENTSPVTSTGTGSSPATSTGATLGDVGDKTSSQLGNLKRPQNWVNKFELDMNMGKDPSNISNAKWVDLAQGISSITPTSNDTTTKASYWNDKGFQEMGRYRKRHFNRC